MNEPLRFTTMREGRRESGCFGCQLQEGVGESTGRGQIGARESGGFRAEDWQAEDYVGRSNLVVFVFATNKSSSTSSPSREPILFRGTED